MSTKMYELESIDEEIRNEMQWALDNIMPWDDFWLDVPDKYVLDATDIIPGKCSIGEDIKNTGNTKQTSGTNKSLRKQKRIYKNWAWNPNGERRAKTGYGIR